MHFPFLVQSCALGEDSLRLYQYLGTYLDVKVDMYVPKHLWKLIEISKHTRRPESVQKQSPIFALSHKPSSITARYLQFQRKRSGEEFISKEEK